MELFNTREIAIGMWLSTLLVLGLSKDNIRSAIYGVIGAFCQKKLLIVFTLMIGYISLTVYGLAQLGLWDFSQAKNTILWALTVAPVSLFRVPAIAEDEDYFRKALVDNFKVIAAFEFVVTFYTFPLWIELIVIPISAFLVMVQAYSERKSEYKIVTSTVTNALALMGITLTLYAGYKLATDFQSFAKRSTISDFMLPIVLATLYLPFLYALNLFVSYENAFVRIEIFTKNAPLRRHTKLAVLTKLNFRTKLLKRWLRNFNISRPTSPQEVEASIAQVKRIAGREKNPPPVDTANGWSPYEAREFLVSTGLKTSDYHPDQIDGSQWYASSPYLEIGEEVLPNNIAYYVEGDEHTAHTLRLTANFNNLETQEQTLNELAGRAAELFVAAMQQPISDDLLNRLVSGTPSTITSEDKVIEITNEDWPSGRGFSLRFIIRTQHANIQSRHSPRHSQRKTSHR